MADAPETPSPASEIKADKKTSPRTGPVKPPVLEGTARPADAGDGKKVQPEQASKSASKPSDAPKPPQPPTPPAPPKSDNAARNSGHPIIAGVVGGVIGLGAAYGLALAGLWPTTPQAVPAPDSRIAQFATAVPELQTATGRVEEQLGALTARIEGLEQRPVAEGTAAEIPADIVDQIAALSERVQTLASANETASASVSTDQVDALESELAAVRSAQDATAQQLQETQTKLEAAVSAAEASATSTDSLALVLSGLDHAFSSGRPYGQELAVLREALPNLTIPQPISSRAETGLPRVGEVNRSLALVLPDMLAGQPLPENANWQDTAASWFRGVIALRPSAEVEGASPDAVMARLEAAVMRGDFVQAHDEFQALPASMMRAGGDLGAQIEALAAADSFMVEARRAALVGGGAV